MPEKKEKPIYPLRRIVYGASYYIPMLENPRSNAGVKCFYDDTTCTYLKGYIIKMKYNRGSGYYWDATEFTEHRSRHKTSTVFPLIAFQKAGLIQCPQCGKPLYNMTLHDFEECMPITTRLGHFIYRNKERIRIFFTRLFSKY